MPQARKKAKASARKKTSKKKPKTSKRKSNGSKKGEESRPPVPPEEWAALELAARKQRKLPLLGRLRKWYEGGTPLSPSDLAELAELVGDRPKTGVVRTQREVSQAFEVSIRTVKNWLADGMPRLENGYSLLEIQTWRDGNGSNGNAAGDQLELGLKDRGRLADVLYREAKREKEELAVAERKGLFIPRKEVEERDVARMVVLRRRLLALPKTLAPAVVGMEPREIEAWSREYVEDILRGFADERVPSTRKELLEKLSAWLEEERREEEELAKAPAPKKRKRSSKKDPKSKSRRKK